MAIHTQRIAASRNSRDAPEVVLLHGWGMSSVVWQSWLPLLREHYNITLLDLPGYGGSDIVLNEGIDEPLAAMLAVLPERAVYMGYSLGGMLATRLAFQFPARASALITFSSNARFVAGTGWPWAMATATFDAFYQSLLSPAVALKRFAGLQIHGCSEEKRLLKALRNAQENIPESALRLSLDWLRDIDNCNVIHMLDLPSLFCFAQNDALVPVAVAEHFPPANTVVLPDAAHAMFFSHPQQCAELVLDFLGGCQQSSQRQEERKVRNKQDVARSFGRAANTYDAVADLQRRIGATLLKIIPEAFAAPQGAIVDLGCGTGFFLPSLRRRFSHQDVIGLDLSEGMLNYAARHRGHELLLCGDAENLPLAEQSAALVFSSLTMQWCENIDALFAEVFRVLRPGGLFVFSTLGPDTLTELRQAWRQVDNYVHVNQFAGWSQVTAAMRTAGFVAPVEPDAERVTLEYDTFLSLARELKSLGAHNVNSGRPAGLTARRRLAKLTENYEQHRNDRGLLPATYQVWYGALAKQDVKRG